MPSVAVFLGEGRAELAGQSVPVAPAGPDAALRLLPDGPSLRALSFGERGRLARSAAQAAEPERELAASVLAQAMTEPGAHPAAAALALHLAGAGSAEIGFSAAQSLLARHLGWSQADLAAAPAAEVDALAEDWRRSLQTGPSGWTKIVFKGAEAGQGGDPQTLALSLARDLLTRAQAGIDPQELAPLAGAAPVRSAGIASAFGCAQSMRENVEDTPTIGPAARSRGGETPENGGAGMDAAGQPVVQPAAPGLARAEPDVAVDALPEPFAAPEPAGSVQTDAAAQDTGPQFLPRAQAAQAAPEAGPSVGIPKAEAGRSGARPANIPAQTRDIWGARVPLAARQVTPASSTAPGADLPATHAFATWFDADTDRPDAVAAQTQPAWVWDQAELRRSPEPDLPAARPLPPAEDALDAVADALHLAADLRGIAP